MRAARLTDRQEAALYLLVDLVEVHGRAGPWLDREPAVPLEMWRTMDRGRDRAVRSALADRRAGSL